MTNSAEDYRLDQDRQAIPAAINNALKYRLARPRPTFALGLQVLADP